jgi:hypothetical protein
MPKAESKSGDEVPEAALLQRAIKYCWSNNFLDVFRAYFKKHAHHFERIAEEKTEEHDLVFQDLFQVTHPRHFFRRPCVCRMLQ